MRYNSEDFIVETVADIYEDHCIGKLGFDLIQLCKDMGHLVFPYDSFLAETEEDRVYLLEKQDKDGFSWYNPKSEKCEIPIYSNGLENKGIYGYTDKATIFEKCVTVSARGTVGYCCLREEPFVPIVRLLIVIPNDENMVDYLYRQLKDLNFEGSGSVQNQLTAPHIENQEILIPNSNLFKEYNEKLNPVMTLINKKEQENQTLTQMQTLLLSKMGV